MDRPGRRTRRELSGREKGLGLAYLILLVGGALLALPLTGIVTLDKPDRADCVPDYSKCLDPAASDYDCQGDGDGPNLVSGPFVVTGDDPFDLDPDDNGFACE